MIVDIQATLIIRDDWMKTWKWVQPNNKVCKVVLDYNAGSIYVFDENGKMNMEKTGLSKDAIEIIEESFLNVVANKEFNKKQDSNDNPMYI